MFWWLFWSELMQRCLAPRPLRSQTAVAGRAAHRVGSRRRQTGDVRALPVSPPRPRRAVLRLVCVDGVRVDRAAS